MPVKKRKDKLVTDDDRDDNEEFEASSIDVQGPASALKAACTGFLLKRLELWLDRVPDLVEEFGLSTWQELRPYAHMQPGEIGESFRDLVQEKTEGEQQLRVSIPHTRQLGQLISELARANAETLSPPRGSLEQSGATDRTESQLTRKTAEMAIYNSIKGDIKLETVYGEGRPAHISDTLDYVAEVAKLFVGMEGYAQLKDIVQARRDTPGLTLEAMMASHNLPDELLAHFARQLYAGLTTRYKKEVLQKSRYAEDEATADSMHVDGIAMAYVLLEASLDVTHLQIAEKRVAYLKGAAVAPNSRAAISKAFDKYLRDTTELHQLRELGSVRKTAPLTQYDAGTVLLTNYRDVADTWNRMWSEKNYTECTDPEMLQPLQMQQLRVMAWKVKQMIKDLPDIRVQPQPSGPRQIGTPGVLVDPGPDSKNVCREFQRTGKCRWQSKPGGCKFSHDTPIVMHVDTTDAHVMALQDTMMRMVHLDKSGQEEDTVPMQKDDFALIYDTAYGFVGTEGFYDTHNELLCMVAVEAKQQQDEDDPVGSWRLI